MRILYLTNGFPFPLTSGYLRHYFLIRGLSERHSVSLLSLVGRSFRPEDREALTPFTHRIQTFGRPAGRRSKARQAWNLLRSLFPGGVDKAALEMRSAVERSLAEETFDVVMFSGKQTYPAIAGLRNIPIVADMCDATSVRIRGRMPYSSSTRRAALWLEYLQVRNVERRLLERTSHALFASCRDREALLGTRTERATVIPNGVDLEYWTRRSARLGTDTVVMTGAMDYAPNHDAARVLIEEIFPLVLRALPEARLFVVGRDPSPDLIRAGTRPGVHVTGLVPDVRPYLEQACVFVAPLRFGAGIQNKLLEAMAMELPVVASALAADGLRTEGGQIPPMTVATTPDDFAVQIVERLRAARRDPTPDASGRRFVEEHFMWGRSTARLERIMAALVDGDRA